MMNLMDEAGVGKLSEAVVGMWPDGHDEIVCPSMKMLNQHSTGCRQRVVTDGASYFTVHRGLRVAEEKMASREFTDLTRLGKSHISSALAVSYEMYLRPSPCWWVLKAIIRRPFSY